MLAHCAAFEAMMAKLGVRAVVHVIKHFARAATAFAMIDASIAVNVLLGSLPAHDQHRLHGMVLANVIVWGDIRMRNA